MISCPPNTMPVSETLQKAWDEANSLIENGDPEKALDILRDAWAECKNDTQRSQTSRYAADAGTLWGEMDVNAQKRRWQKAYKNYKTALDFNPKDKETRRRMNKLASMMDENGISINSGFQMFSEGNPTPMGILAIVVSTMIFLTSFKIVTEALDPDGIGLWDALTGGEESSDIILLNSSVVLEISYVDSTDTRVDVDVEIELRPDFAPIHVENFLKLTSDGKYDNTEFHRIIDNFMIQGGDIDHLEGRGGYAGKWFGYCNGQESNSSDDCDPSSWTIPDETSSENPGLLHESCTISMAKTAPPNTGGSQFFLIPEDSEPKHLNGVHTVFGEIVSGCEHVTAISEVPTSGESPVNTVQLKNAYIVV